MYLKVALVNPVTKSREMVIRTGRCQTRTLPGIGIWPPIGLAQIAGMIRTIPAVKDIRIIDAQISDTFESMISKIIKYSPDVLIVNCTTPTIYDDLDLAKMIKTKKPEALIVFYGTHGRARPQDILHQEGSAAVDCVIVSEPELTARELCQKYARDGLRGLKEVAGLALRTSTSELVLTKTRDPIENLDDLGIPARDLLDNDQYKLPYNGKPFTIIQSSQGCPKRCSYCTAPMFTEKITLRSITSIISELEEIINKYGINEIMFLSDTFTVSKKWTQELCTEIVTRGLNISWIANSRVDTLDEEMAYKMKRAGCWAVSLGIESGSDLILKRANKGITQKDIWRTVSILNKAGIKIIGYFMFGLPGETKKTIEATIELACQLPIDYAYFYVATPFPGTKFFKEAEKNGWLRTMDWSRYFHGESDVLEYEDLSAQHLSYSVKRAYRKFYMRPSHLFKYLKDIKSPNMFMQYLIASINLLKEKLT